MNTDLLRTQFETWALATPPDQRTNWEVFQAGAAALAAQPAQEAPASFPAAIWQLLLTVADRKGTEYTGPWEGPNGEPMQDDADAAIAWIRAAQPAQEAVAWVNGHELKCIHLSEPTISAAPVSENDVPLYAAPQPTQAPTAAQGAGEIDWLDIPGAATAWNNVRKAARALSPTGNIAEILNAAAALADLAAAPQRAPAAHPSCNNVDGQCSANCVYICHAEPAPAAGDAKPAAWIRWEWNRSGGKSLVFERPAELSLSEEARGVVYEPLYGRSEAPLSDRAILDLVPSTMPIANDFNLLWFARAIERAHGITAAPGGEDGK